jgi:glycosyltransferase involved in cell wall biosynthesis
MRIGFVTHQYFPEHYTGVERDTLNLTNQLRQLGHRCVVIAPSFSHPDHPPTYTYSGTVVRTVDPREPNRLRPWAGPPSTGAEIGQILDEEHIELVHVAHTLRMPQIYEEAARRNLPAVVHVHDYDYFCYRVIMVRDNGVLCPSSERGQACIDICQCPTAPARIEWGQRVLASAAAVVSPSRFLIDLFASEGFDTTDWHHVRCGVDYSRFPRRLPAPESDRLHIGFIGTLLPHKGAHLLIEALQLVPDLRATLMIYGESFGLTDWDARLARMVAGDQRIRLMGPYRYNDFVDVLAPLDAVAIPSLWYENYPIAAAAAVAAGVPIIASDTGGLKELVDDFHAGFMFELGDARSLADLLVLLAEDRDLLRATRDDMLYPPSVEEEAYAVDEIYRDVIASQVMGLGVG